MKTNFDLNYIFNNLHCYPPSELVELPFEKDNINLETLFEILPIKNFCRFLVNKCKLTTTEQQLFSLSCATFVLPIYQNKYHNCTILLDSIKSIKGFLEGTVTLDSLKNNIQKAYGAARNSYLKDGYTDYSYAAYTVHLAAAFLETNNIFTLYNIYDAAYDAAHNMLNQHVKDFVWGVLIKS